MSVLPPLLLVPLDSLGTMETVMLLVPLVAALKETSARESALLVHGHTIMAATGTAPLSTPPMMPVLIRVPLELPFRTVFARLVLRAVLQDSILIPPPPHAWPASTLVLSVLSLPHIVLLAQPVSP